MIERIDSDLSLSVQSSLLGISRSSLYYQICPPSPEEVAIRHRIDEIYTRYPFYGSRRIREALKREGIVVNRKRVQGLMADMGITAIYPGPNLSKRDLENRIYPYLLKGVKAAYPDHIWGIDITYIRLDGGWMYLVVNGGVKMYQFRRPENVPPAATIFPYHLHSGIVSEGPKRNALCLGQV